MPQASKTVGSCGAATCVEQATVVPPSAGTVKSGMFSVIVCVTVADMLQVFDTV